MTILATQKLICISNNPCLNTGANQLQNCAANRFRLTTALLFFHSPLKKLISSQKVVFSFFKLLG
jgi:hypothetical protein